jgi:peptidyl-prolyl cis-trans isomerase D
MLKFFRKHARGWFMLAIIVIIIIVFVLYFGSDRGSRSANAIAIIDGRVISEAEFHNEYGKMLDMVKLRYGSKLTPEALKMMNLKQRAYDNLINQQIIIAKAADLKLQISDEELRNAIMSLPALQTDGIFDERKYQQMLRYTKSSAEDFETTQRINLTANKIETLIREGIKISDQEIFDLYTLQNQKINLSFVQISGKDVKMKSTPTTEELENYSKSNSNTFRIPEQVKIKYLFFSSNAYSSASISDSDIRDYYNRFRDKYRTKDGKQSQLADVKNTVIKELKTARGMQNAYTEAKKAHDVIYQEDNFEAYVTKNNLKTYSADFFPLNKPPQALASVKELAAVLLELQKNDISKVLPANDGYYLVKVIDKKQAYTPVFKDIENEVKRRFVENEILILAEKEAQSILDRLKNGEQLEKIAREKSLKINETGLFLPSGTIPKLGSSKEAADTLYQLSANKPYPEKLLIINNTFVILKFKDASKVDLKDFAAKKDLYKNIFSSIKREEALLSWLDGNKIAMIKEKRVKINKEVKDL